jgi:Ca2+-binding EF-hand superfamily protein
MPFETQVFNQIDVDQKGYISEEDVAALADDLKEEIPIENIREMIKKCDPSGTGRISWEAFLAFNKKKKF